MSEYLQEGTKLISNNLRLTESVESSKAVKISAVGVNEVNRRSRLRAWTSKSHSSYVPAQKDIIVLSVLLVTAIKYVEFSHDD